MDHSPIVNYLNIAESQSLKVLLYLLEHRDGNNVVLTTLDTVAKECQVTKVTVNRVFKRLYAQEFMSKIRNGQYQLHKI